MTNNVNPFTSLHTKKKILTKNILYRISKVKIWLHFTFIEGLCWCWGRGGEEWCYSLEGLYTPPSKNFGLNLFFRIISLLCLLLGEVTWQQENRNAHVRYGEIFSLDNQGDIQFPRYIFVERMKDNRIVRNRSSISDVPLYF